MAEELQSLLEKIQRDGIAKADEKAEALIKESREKALQILAEAQKSAAGMLAKADQESAAYTERSRKALELAARDVLLAVGNAINQTLKGLIRREVAAALSADTVKKILPPLVDAYLQSAARGAPVTVLLNPAQRAELGDFILQRFRGQLQQGLQIKGDAGILAGFKVEVAGGIVRHDLTDEAIAESLSQLLRPQIAAIVREAAGKAK